MNTLQRGVTQLIDIKIDDDVVNKKLDEAISERVDELAHDRYFMTMKELSEYVNLSTPVIKDRLIMNGLPHYRVGQKYLFRKKDVDSFLDSVLENLTGTNDLKFFEGLK